MPGLAMVASILPVAVILAFICVTHGIAGIYTVSDVPASCDSTVVVGFLLLLVSIKLLTFLLLAAWLFTVILLVFL